jgi:hypothetical protein
MMSASHYQLTIRKQNGNPLGFARGGTEGIDSTLCFALVSGICRLWPSLAGFCYLSENKMSIVRVVKEERGRYLFTAAEPYENSELSFGARGLHAYLMTKPDNWEVRRHHLIHASPAGREAVQRMINELKLHGYMNIETINDPETGKLVNITTVYEKRELNPAYGGTMSPNDGKTGGRETRRSVGEITDRRENRPTVKPIDGKPVGLVNTDLSYINKPPMYEHEELGYQEPDHDTVQEMITALSSVCKGVPNILVPDRCPFYQAAISLLDKDYTPIQVSSFGSWWQKYGLYEGQPALKSLLDNLDNSIMGIKVKQSNGQITPELRIAHTEIDMWLRRKIKPADFSDERTLKAIRAVGEQGMRSINSRNRKTIMSQFDKAFLE